MRVSVRYFAVLRERRGVAREDVDLPEGTTAQEAYARMCVPADVPVAFAINTEVAAGTTVLQSGDELALLPPVGGG